MSLYKCCCTCVIVLLNLIVTVVHAQSSVWKVSHGGKHFYLGGTVHLLSENDHPLPEAFLRAYQHSDKVIFETDISAASSPQAQQKFNSVMRYSANDALVDNLEADTYERLARFLTDRQLPIASFAGLRPWGVAMTLTMVEYQRIGMAPEYGVDSYFHRKAQADNKSIGYLETINQQIKFIASMSTIDPDVMIRYTLRDLKQLPTFAKFLKDSWRSGDIEAFTRHSMIERMRTEFPSLYETLLVNRNDNWMPILLDLNHSKEVELVLVGTLHLNGTDGLLHRLEQAGYAVEQI